MPAANVIRELFVALGVKYSSKDKKEVAEFDKALDKIKGQMEDLAGVAVTVGKVLVGAMLGAAAAAGALVVTSGENAQNIERQARALNLTRKEYQEFQHVFGTFGADSKEISEAFLQITEKAVTALGGSKEAVAEFGLIGIKVDQLKGKRPNELFELIADSMAKTTDRQKALGAASKLFGEDTAKKLLPALVQGSAGIRKLREEASALGAVMTDRQLARLKLAAVAWNRFKTAVKGLGQSIGAALAPVVTKLLAKITEWITKNRELIALRVEQAVERVSRAVSFLLDLVDRMGGWGVILANVATGAGMLTLLANLGRVQELLGAIRLAVIAVQVAAAPMAAAIGLPLGVIVAGLAALVAGLVLAGLAVDDYLTYWRGGDSVLGDNIKRLEQYVPILAQVRELFGALIVFAIGLVTAAGKLANAVRVGLQPVFDHLAQVLQNVLDKAGDLWRFLTGKSDLLGGLIALVRGGTAFIGSTADQVAPQLQGAVAGAVSRQFVNPPGGAGATDNSVRSATLNATIHSAGPLDVQESFKNTFRLAGLAPAGGER